MLLQLEVTFINNERATYPVTTCITNLSDQVLFESDGKLIQFPMRNVKEMTIRRG